MIAGTLGVGVSVFSGVWGKVRVSECRVLTSLCVLEVECCGKAGGRRDSRAGLDIANIGGRRPNSATGCPELWVCFGCPTGHGRR